MKLVVRSLCLAACLGSGAAWAQVAPSPADAALAEARRLLDTLEYERVLSAVDALMPQLAKAGASDSGRVALVTALELRARAHFTLGGELAAIEDFTQLLSIEPGHVMSAQVSPRIAALLERVRTTVVGSVSLTLEPPDLALEVDGRPISSSPLALTAGEHRVTATRAGYRSHAGVLVVTAGILQPLEVRLERVSAALTVITSPPDVEVIINGTRRGSTVAGTLALAYQALPGKLGVSADAIAMPLVVSDLQTGGHVVQFRKPCFRPAERRIQIDKASDYSLEPVVMEPAVASLRVESDDRDATVFLDGEPRGTAPFVLPNLCEGSHVVELRSPAGRYLERVTAIAGRDLTIKGRVRPAFALLAVAGLPEGYRGQDLRLDIERVLRPLAHVTFVVPPAEQLTQVTVAEQLAADSFSFDLAKRALGSAARISASVRRDMVDRITRVMDVQGIATVTVLAGETSMQRLAISLLAAGASEPDVLLVDLQDQRSLLRALEALDVSPPLSDDTFGFLAIEVDDVEGLVVVNVDAGGPAEGAGIKPGERVVRIAGQPVANAAAFWQVARSAREAPDMVLSVTDRAGVAREVRVKRTTAARLVSVVDQTLPFNALAASWRGQSQNRSAGKDEVMLRLNLSVALLRIGDFAAARAELEGLQLPQAPGISAATVQYLLGLAYEGLGDLGRAREAWTRASTATGGWVSDQGGDAAELARRKLKS